MPTFFSSIEYNRHQSSLNITVIVDTFAFFLVRSEINLSAMKYIGKLLILSQASEYKFPTVAQQIEDLQMTAPMKHCLKPILFEFDVQSQSLVDWFDAPVEFDTADESTQYEWMATVIMYRQLSDSFNRFGDCTLTKVTAATAHENRSFEYTCQTLEVLLKCSESARKLADEENFLLCIVDQMIQICEAVHGSFSDFARQNGNAKVI